MDKQNPGYLLFITGLSTLALALLAAEVVPPLRDGPRHILHLTGSFVCARFFADFMTEVPR